MNNKKIAVMGLCLAMIFSFVLIVDITIDFIPSVKGTTRYVNMTGTNGAFTSIQDAINASSDGDTVYVYNGTYIENVIVNKTINLAGEDRENTIINGSNNGHVVRITSDWVNITGFTITNSGSQALDAGINLESVSNIRIINNNISRNNYHGIYADYSNGNYIYINDNKFMNNSWGAIWFQYGPFNYGEIHNNTINYNMWGIILNGGSSTENSKFFNITENTLVGNWLGILFYCARNNSVINNKVFSSERTGLLSGYYSNYNYYYNNIFESDEHGLRLDRDSKNIFVNNTLYGGLYDIYFDNDYTSIVTILNNTFNKSKVFYDWPDSTLIVNWYLHIDVIDYLGNPVSSAKVKIEDNNNGTYNDTFITDINGQINWLPITEYIERDPDGDTIGEKTFYTPHKIAAWNDTLVGYAQPIMNESKTVTIVLGNGTLMDLEPGWNLISLPRIQSDTNLPKVLQSIEGQYDAVQWYNITDSNDPWKHNHISKPSNLNDLNEINHTMGLWVHITDPGGTTLVVFGDVLTSTQNITLYPGWNLVGYPSLNNKNRTDALNNIDYGSDVDAIWTYNATSQKWKEITASDNFEVCRGYWIHSKVTKTWIVPL